MPKDTTKCENCDAVIAKDAKECPACGLNLEELDDRLKELDTLEKIRAKRNKTIQPPTVKRKGLFGSLTK